MDLNGLPQTVQNFINDTIQYRESGNCLDYDTCQKILEYAADTGSQKLTGLGLYYPGIFQATDTLCKALHGVLILALLPITLRQIIESKPNGDWQPPMR